MEMSFTLLFLILNLNDCLCVCMIFEGLLEKKNLRVYK